MQHQQLPLLRRVALQKMVVRKKRDKNSLLRKRKSLKICQICNKCQLRERLHQNTLHFRTENLLLMKKKLQPIPQMPWIVSIMLLRNHRKWMWPKKNRKKIRKKNQNQKLRKQKKLKSRNNLMKLYNQKNRLKSSLKNRLSSWVSILALLRVRSQRLRKNMRSWKNQTKIKTKLSKNLQKLEHNLNLKKRKKKSKQKKRRKRKRTNKPTLQVKTLTNQRSRNLPKCSNNWTNTNSNTRRQRPHKKRNKFTKMLCNSPKNGSMQRISFSTVKLIMILGHPVTVQ